jgi:GTP-binding protein Era
VDAEVIILLVDAAKGMTQNVRNIIDRLAQNPGQKVALALNKIDTLRPPALLKLAQEMNEAFDFEATFMISALKNKGFKDLMAYVAKKMPERPYLYP